MPKKHLYALLFSALFLLACESQADETGSISQPSPDLLVSQSWVRETPPGAKVAAAFATVKNPGNESKKIIGVRFDVAGAAEIHTMSMVDGMMRMRRLKYVEIAAGSSHQFKPGSDHMMLFRLSNPLRTGTQVKGFLQLQNGNEIAFELPVRSGPPE